MNGAPLNEPEIPRPGLNRLAELAWTRIWRRSSGRGTDIRSMEVLFVMNFKRCIWVRSTSQNFFIFLAGFEECSLSE